MKNTVKNIIDRVKKNGDSAVVYFTKKYDKVNLTSKQFKVSGERLATAYKNVDKNFLSAVKQAKKNIELFQKKICPKPSVLKSNGIILKYVFKSIEKVGVYIPGGKFAYPSTVMMTVVPAKVAGVRRIIMVSPPKNLTNEVLAAAVICGVDEVYGIGGAQAVAALAYGTKTIPKVDKIVGPGNVFVTEAKRQVFGDVGIDMLAGPSEVLIIADDTANIDFVVADLSAQCEHDKNAKAFLVSLSPKLSTAVKNKTKSIAKQIKIINVRSVDHAIKIADEIASEHIEIIVKNSVNIADKIKNTGAVFIGNYSPVAIGDYFAGPSHVLPTSATAKFSSGLSVYDFLKAVPIIQYDKFSLLKSSKAIMKLAEVEGMEKHAVSIRTRIKSVSICG